MAPIARNGPALDKKTTVVTIVMRTTIANAQPDSLFRRTSGRRSKLVPETHKTLADNPESRISLYVPDSQNFFSAINRDDGSSAAAPHDGARVPGMTARNQATFLPTTPGCAQEVNDFFLRQTTPTRPVIAVNPASNASASQRP